MTPHPRICECTQVPLHLLSEIWLLLFISLFYCIMDNLFIYLYLLYNNYFGLLNDFRFLLQTKTYFSLFKFFSPFPSFVDSWFFHLVFLFEFCVIYFTMIFKFHLLLIISWLHFLFRRHFSSLFCIFVLFFISSFLLCST